MSDSATTTNYDNSKEIQDEIDTNRVNIDGYWLFVNVWNSAASLAVARPHTDDKGRYYEDIKGIDDLDALGLEYSDLLEAVERQGMVNMSRWYAVTPKIERAVREHLDVIKAAFR